MGTPGPHGGPPYVTPILRAGALQPEGGWRTQAVGLQDVAGGRSFNQYTIGIAGRTQCRARGRPPQKRPPPPPASPTEASTIESRSAGAPSVQRAREAEERESRARRARPEPARAIAAGRAVAPSRGGPVGVHPVRGSKDGRLPGRRESGVIIVLGRVLQLAKCVPGPRGLGHSILAGGDVGKSYIRSVYLMRRTLWRGEYIIYYSARVLS
jgi:hypothetical protein